MVPFDSGTNLSTAGVSAEVCDTGGDGGVVKEGMENWVSTMLPLVRLPPVEVPEEAEFRVVLELISRLLPVD